MKKFDYIVIQAPMISELGLKGNSLLLFAMIHGFSKDGVNRYRASLNDMCEWLCTSKSSISPTLNALVEAGYINKHSENSSAPEYTTNYDELLAKAAAEGPLKPTLVYKEKAEKNEGVRNPYHAQKGLDSRGTESVPGTESGTKGYGIRNERVRNPYPINIINIINKYSCCYEALTAEQKEQEEKQFFKIFFFRGAADPAAEVKRFVAHNQANGWQNKSGKVYDNTDKRLGLAELWEFKTGQREGKAFIRMWQEVYNRCADQPDADKLLDSRIKITATPDVMTIHCTKETAQVLESNIAKVRDLFVSYAAGKKIMYMYIQ